MSGDSLSSLGDNIDVFTTFPMRAVLRTSAVYVHLDCEFHLKHTINRTRVRQKRAVTMYNVTQRKSMPHSTDWDESGAVHL